MAWWDFVGGIFGGAKDVAEVFVPNKEKQSKRSHKESMADIDRDMAALQQFTKEFHQRLNRTWWDSFVDGLNRLPRPLLTFSIVGLFVLAPIDPARFLQIAKAYELMPPGYWALLTVIIGFYFGGRMQLKSQDMAVKKDALQAAKDLVSMKQEFRKLDEEDESTASKIFDAALSGGARKITNSVVQGWLASKAS
ncbi:hypothetical protein A9Q99_19925 [Gammaproteobacteria bacterium 45_16_T64]|nr:hypothetical protein A9Q99_19925 [Gammaproteobacteria bacterium 45_16_T64]